MGKSRAVMGDVPAYADPNITIYLDVLWSGRRDSNPRPHLGKKKRRFRVLSGSPRALTGRLAA